MSLESSLPTDLSRKETDDGDMSQYHDSTPTSEASIPPPIVAGANKDVLSEPSIAEGAFHSERSKVLFDAIDQFQSCGAGKFMDIPQLVIVGDQSSGKSSLLQSLTDIPFPVGTACCTRFATRIVSRRTAPGTSNKVTITITPPDFRIDDFEYPPNETYREYFEMKESLTSEEFSKVMEEVTTKYMGINPGTGLGKKNFAVEVLKVEIAGPTRSHFSILDIPGIFSNPYNVEKREKSGVQRMVVEYMKQPENIVICVADAVTDLARQKIFTLANEHVDKSRLIGVFTKCDLALKADATQVVAITDGSVEGVGQLLHHGWFVVRNRAGDDDEDPHFDLQDKEAELFNRPPWVNISRERKGSAMLKKYLGKLLCNKIEAAFPRLLDKLSQSMRKAKMDIEKLGEPRTTHSQRRGYLANIAEKYASLAKDSLERPWSLDSTRARARYLSRLENDMFGDKMRAFGHVYEFQGHDLKEEDYLREITGVLRPGGVLATQTNTEQAAHENSLSPLQPDPRIEPVRSSEELYVKIRDEVRICGCTELPGLVNPDIVRRLYRDQTHKWGAVAEAHLRTVAEKIDLAAQEILDTVCDSRDDAGMLHAELLLILRRFYDGALRRALASLRDYCGGEQSKMLQTTDPGFTRRLQILQTLRMVNLVRIAHEIASVDNVNKVSTKELQNVLYAKCHHSTVENTVNDVHDVLKVYYEISLESFIQHINSNIIESFIADSEGPLKGLSMEYIYSLPAEEVDWLGRESREVAEKRLSLENRIKTLQVAEKAAQRATARTSSPD